MSLTINFQEVNQEVKKLLNWEKNVVKDCLNWGTEALYKEITQKDMPYNTGNYKRSWKKKKPKNHTITVETPMGQLMIWLEFTGTKPHIIVPKGPGYPLHWVDPDTGEHRYAMKVNHPGTNPTPHLRPAIEKFLPKWEDYIMRKISKYYRWIG